jgi:hypothetical protein
MDFLQLTSTGGATMNAAIVIPICCVCNRVREHLQPAAKQEGWDTLEGFLRTHHISSGEYRLTHTYCPACAEQFSTLGRTDGKASIADRAPSSPTTDAAAVILDVFSSVQKCDLDMLVRACPTLTWNQVFSEVDRLSRARKLRLNYLGHGQYSIELPAHSSMPVVAQV